MGGLTNTKYEQTQRAQYSSWFALSHTYWARLRGRGMYLWPTRFMLHESIHLPIGFEFPTVSFYWVFAYFSLPALKGKPKALSLSWCSLFSIFLPGWVPSAPSPRHVASTPSCWAYEAMRLIPLTTFSAFSLHLILFPHLYLFSQLMKHTEQSFSSPATLSWLKQSLKTLFMTCINQSFSRHHIQLFHSCGFSQFFNSCFTSVQVWRSGWLVHSFPNHLCGDFYAVVQFGLHFASLGWHSEGPTQPRCCWHLTLSSPGNF